MWFYRFEWPKTKPLTLEVDTDSWKVINSWEEKAAPQRNESELYGHWCNIEEGPLYVYRNEKILTVHYAGKTYEIEAGSKEYSVTNKRRWIFWKYFELTKENERILSCSYRDPDTLVMALVAALAYDDEFLWNPFDEIADHLSWHPKK